MKYYNNKISELHDFIQSDRYLITDGYYIKDCTYLLNEKSDLIYTPRRKPRKSLRELEDALRDLFEDLDE